MFRNATIRWGAVGLLFAMSNGALTQELDLYRAPGVSEGNAGTEASRIRRQDIGMGFSGSNLIHQSLNRASISTPNIGGYTGRTMVGANNRSTLGGTTSAPAASFRIGGGGVASKPFSSASNGPTISPYLNLFREDLDGFSDFNYQTLVRPQLQQQQINQDLQRQQLELNKNIQALSARQDYNPQGSTTQAPTGHSTTFRYHSHYYPTIGQNRRAR